MRIIEEIQLNYKDVLIRPKRSTLTSRSEVSLLRTFKFPYGKQSLTCHPIIASNMDCTGTFEMAKALAEENCMTALHKFFPAVELNSKFKIVINNTWYSLGMRDEDLDKVNQLAFTPKFINIDVPNGYLQKFVDHCAAVREKYPDAVIMAGNVSTGEMVEELIVNGKVDVVKIFIGPGCFTGDTLVKTNLGYKPIKNIKIGDMVLTHDGTYQQVIGTKTREENSDLININNVLCTKNHEFYVVHISDIDKINDDNIHTYAKWIKAEELSEEFMLIENTVDTNT